VTTDGYEIIEVSLPAVTTMNNELGKPHYRTVQRILIAFEKHPMEIETQFSLVL